MNRDEPRNRPLGNVDRNGSPSKARDKGFSSVCLALTCISLSLGGCTTPGTLPPRTDPALALAEAQKQAALAVQLRQAQLSRLHQVGQRVLMANAPDCGRTTGGLSGVTLSSIYDYPAPLRAAAATYGGLSDLPRVTAVQDDGTSPLKSGDEILSVEGVSVIPTDKDKKTRKDKALTPLRHFQAQIWSASEAGTRPVAVMAARGDDEISLTLTPQAICDYPLELQQDAGLNAYTDGKSIVVNLGLMRLASRDEDLALVISHELAHNTLSHIEAKDHNALIGAVSGILADAAAGLAGWETEGAFTDMWGRAGLNFASPSFETEADFVATYYVHNAGYSISGIEDFWRRMAVEHPQSIFVATTHPTTAERFIGLTLARKDLETRLASAEPLVSPKSRPRVLDPVTSLSTLSSGAKMPKDLCLNFSTRYLVNSSAELMATLPQRILFPWKFRDGDHNRYPFLRTIDACKSQGLQ